MSVAINDLRVVPVGEDLTKDDLSCQVLRGLEQAHRADVKLAVGASLEKGEFAVLQSDGSAGEASSSASHGYLVFAGSERFDVKASGKVTLLMASKLIVKSSKYDTAASYAVGDSLTVKTTSPGMPALTKQSGDEPAVARVLEVGSGYLVYEIL